MRQNAKRLAPVGPGIGLVLAGLGVGFALYMMKPVVAPPPPVPTPSVTLEILELGPDEHGEKHPSWRRSSKASPGTVVRLCGDPLVHTRGEVSVSIGEHPCPVMKRDEHAVVCMVPPMAPGTSAVTVTTPGSEVPHPIVVQPIPRLDGTPGDVTRRFLDEVELLLAQSRQHPEHPAVRAVTGRLEDPAIGASTGGVVQQIVFLIDVSHSMKAPDLGPSRLDLAKETIIDLLRLTVRAAETVSTSQGTALQYRIGVTPFAGNGLTQKYGVPPTDDLDKVARVVDALSTHSGTSIGRGFKEAARQLGEGGGIIVLLSDGKESGSNKKSPDHPLRILGNIEEQGKIVIHTIGIGAPGHEGFDESLL
jgi:hypothetical protein